MTTCCNSSKPSGKLSIKDVPELTVYSSMKLLWLFRKIKADIDEYYPAVLCMYVFIQVLSDVDKERTFVFSTFFYTRLTQPFTGTAAKDTKKT